jgi:hypothetical protein
VSEPRSGRVTTTVRFDADQWSGLAEQADRLGVRRAAFIRDAVAARVATLDERDRRAALCASDDFSALLARVERAEVLARMALRWARAGRA